MGERIGLFPLGTVLYPGLVLPLHVFEPRYRALVADLVALPEGVPRRFGVVAIRDGSEVGPGAARSLYSVGCTAELRSVTAHPDGRFDIVTNGAHRFRVIRIQDPGPASAGGYLQAEIDQLADVVDQESLALDPVVRADFAAYQEALAQATGGPGATDPSTLPTSPVILSYLVSAALVATLPDKQRLLEAPGTGDRLHLAHRLLRVETRLITATGTLPGVDLLHPATSPN
ncbi:MAG: LON peptidase substrate-binding domain-containing protein [Actinomycetes bacterium]